MAHTHCHFSKNQAGVTLLLSILVLSSILAISFSLATILFVEVRTSGDLLRTETSYYADQAAAEQGLFKVMRGVSSAQCANSSCYTNNVNGVALTGSNGSTISESSLSDAVQQDIIPPGGSVGTDHVFPVTAKYYSFYDLNNPAGGSGYGSIKLTYLSSGNTDALKVYICQFDPSATYATAACSDPQSSEYWLVGAGGSGGPFSLTPGSSAHCWGSGLTGCFQTSSGLDPTKQQEMVLVNDGSTGPIYVQIETRDSSGNLKGIPYFNQEAVDINGQSSDVNRRIRVYIPTGGASSSGSGSGSGTGSGFSSSKTITINHAQVSNSDQSNFPVLIAGTYSYLATAANGGGVQNSSGYDIGFYTNSDCSTGKMNWETESYNASTGAVAYWVNVSVLSHTSDTVFYMCYGNSAITSDQSNKTAVWDSNYKAVYHLDEAANTTRNDSTSNANNALDTSANIGQGSGEIGSGAAFTNSKTQLLSPSASIALKPPLQFDAWIKFNSFVSYPAIFGNQYSSGKYTRAWFATNTFTMYDDSNVASASATVSVSAGPWYQVSVSVSSAGTSYISINGATPTQFGTIGVWANKTLTFKQFGNMGGNLAGLNGTMDEVRISNIQRPTGWSITEYNNQSNPSGFYTIN